MTNRQKFSMVLVLAYCANSCLTKSITAVLRTWQPDATLAAHALQSLIDVIPHKHTLSAVVITDSASKIAVRRAMRSVKGSRRLKKPISLVVEPKMNMNGHAQQKYSKLTSDKYTDDPYLLHVDSDLMYYRWDDACFFDDGLPLIEYASYESLPEFARRWKTGTGQLLGRTVEYEFSRSNQHVYPRELYSDLRIYLEHKHGKTLRNLFETTPLVGREQDKVNAPESAILMSDFNILGAYAYYKNWRRNVKLRNVADGVQAESCVAQCNSRLFSEACCIAWFSAVKRNTNNPHWRCASDWMPGDSSCVQTSQYYGIKTCDSFHLTPCLRSEHAKGIC